jgi:hypothetical protein
MLIILLAVLIAGDTGSDKTTRKYEHDNGIDVAHISKKFAYVCRIIILKFYISDKNQL